MRPIIPDLLWIGNALDARDVRASLSLGVQAVVDLAANESPIQYPRDIAYCRIPLNDGPGNNPAILRLAVSTTAEFVKAKIPALVACGAGMSRSLAVTAAALSVVNRQHPDDALRQIASDGPHDVAPGLWSDLQQIALSSIAGAAPMTDAPALKLLVLKTLQLDRLLAFYSTLGIRFVEERHGTGSLHYSATVGGTVFEIYPATTLDLLDSGSRLGFNVANLMKTVESLCSLGTAIVSEPKERQWGLRAVVRDPDGRAVELYQQEPTGH